MSNNKNGINNNKVYEYNLGSGKMPKDLIDELKADNTAMTNINKRGIREYFPTNFEDKFSAPIKSNIMIERRNNTELTDILLSIDAEAIEQKASVDNAAIAEKAAIDVAAQKKKYETILEYNTQVGMHRMDVMNINNMEKFKKKKNNND